MHAVLVTLDAHLAGAEGEARQAEWQRRFEAYRAQFGAEATEFERRQQHALPAGWDQGLPEFTAENGAVASRAANALARSAGSGTYVSSSVR